MESKLGLKGCTVGLGHDGVGVLEDAVDGDAAALHEVQGALLDLVLRRDKNCKTAQKRGYER